VSLFLNKCGRRKKLDLAFTSSRKTSRIVFSIYYTGNVILKREPKRVYPLLGLYGSGISGVIPPLHIQRPAPPIKSKVNSGNHKGQVSTKMTFVLREYGSLGSWWIILTGVQLTTFYIF